MKRVDDVIRVFCKIKESIPVKLLLVGDGPERDAAESLCRDLGACNDIRFLGKLNAITEVLSVCDLFLMPSEKESFGLAALEAMACEVPVVSSDVGGIPEVNINGNTGYICKLGDVEDMASKAIEILKDENLSRFKKNALSQAHNFEMSKIIPSYEKIYHEIT